MISIAEKRSKKGKKASASARKASSNSRNAVAMRAKTQAAARGPSFLTVLTTVGITLALLIVLFLYLPYLYSSGSISITALQNFEEVAIELIFLSLAFSYLTITGVAARYFPRALGLSENLLNLKMVAYGLLIFLAILALEFGVGAIQNATGVQINTNVGLLLSGTPLWFMLFVVFIGPVCEEILFRGLLVPRVGIIISAIVFGLLHYGYGSTFGIEIIAAFIFGILAGYVYKKTGSLYPSIVAHILVNALAVIAFSGL